MKNNIPTLTEQEKSSIEDLNLSIERARELESQFIENQLPEGFDFCNGELIYKPEGKNDKEAPSPIFICSRLDITTCTRDDANQNHGRLLEFKDIDNHHHVWAMPCSLLAGDGTGYREELLSMGLRIAPGQKARQLLAFYIQSSKPLARARCVNSTGWHKSCYVFPDQTIGLNAKEKLLLQTSSPHFPEYAVSGTLKEWQDTIAALSVGNTRLVFSLCVAFASPLLHLLNQENGGFHFRGASSTGKTTALAVSASVWGSKNYIQRWRATSNGIEALAADHNDALLCLDELSQVDPSIAGEIAYMLANGSGKARADHHACSKKKATWRLLFLSTGEICLAEHMIDAGKKARAGQEVRIIDIPAETHAYGLFENLHGYENGASFSHALNQYCSQYYGSPSREFIKLVVENKETTLTLIKNFMDEFMSTYVPKEASGQVHRVAKRFALVAAAGELATTFGITGWKKAEALASSTTCFMGWLTGRGGVMSQEELAILSQVRRFFEQHGESRFTPWDFNETHKTINRAGFRKHSELGIEYFVFPETFKTDLATGFDHRIVSRVCIKHGLLREGANGEPTRSEKLPNSQKSSRCYRFTSKVLGEE